MTTDGFFSFWRRRESARGSQAMLEKHQRQLRRPGCTLLRGSCPVDLDDGSKAPPPPEVLRPTSIPDTLLPLKFPPRAKSVN